MNSILSPVSLTSFFDNQTGQARQANLFFYKAGTLDPVVVYTDAELMVPFPQPVATTGWGRVPPVYVGEIPAPGYRVRAFDQYETLIEDLSGLPGALPTVPPATGGDLTPEQIQALAQTGDIKLKWSNHNPEPGWVEITKGGTIGDVGSNASLMQSPDAHDLFVHLWQQDINGALAIVGGRGATAEGDWADLKQIAVPDARGRFLAGLDSQILPPVDPPASITGRLDDGLFDDKPGGAVDDKYTPWMLGATGGEATHQLVLTELAVHLHDWIDTYGHTHGIQEGSDNLGHYHQITDPGHDHPIWNMIGTAHQANDLVLGRENGAVNSGYTLQADGSLFRQVALSVRDRVTGISINKVKTGIVLRNAEWGQAGKPGEAKFDAYVGKWIEEDAVTHTGKWHQPTEYQPRPTDWGDPTKPEEVAQRGDKPHNTLPPFILFAIYMKL